ncbi:MAG TPA: hypothetical protein VFW66_01300 [Gemmatimonadales bacterium]|nr:hypothetical protein [Gemmatimonadales bacterium]
MTGLPAPHLTPDDIDACLAGTLPAARARHLAACAECEQAVQAERELADVLARLPLFTPSAGFDARVMAAVRVPDPFALRSLGAALGSTRGRLLATRRSAALTVACALALVASMGTSAAWVLAHRAVFAGAEQWLTADAVQWAWASLRGLALDLMGQPWYGGVRSLIEEPGKLALLSALASLLYVGGLLALRRLLAIPAQRVAHASV